MDFKGIKQARFSKMMDELPDELRQDDFLMYQTEDQFLPGPYMPPLRTGSMESVDLKETSLPSRPPCTTTATSKNMAEEAAYSNATRNTQDPMLMFMQQQNQLMKMLVENNVRASLPQPQVKPYGGNPLDFHSFKKAFEHAVESKTTNYNDRLYYLDQYTRGEANAMVKSCMYGDNPAQAYLKAKSILEEKFGNRHLVLNTMLSKAAAWPSIKAEDPEGLQGYALFLTELNNLAKDIHMEQEINHTQNLKMVISKLPFKLRDKWRSTVDSLLELNDQLSFNDCVRFITKQARILNNPVFGNLGTPRTGESQTKPRAPTQPKQGFTINTKGKNEIATCLYCSKENHTLGDCRILQRKSHQEKIAFCMSKGLCFGCLKSSHLSKDCQQRMTCKLCKRAHPTVLHRTFAPKQEEKVEASGNERKDRADEAQGKGDSETRNQANDKETNTTEQTVDDVKRTLTNYTGQQESQPAIVPVTVRSRESGKTVKTYAFIDNGSNATFITDGLKERLQTKGRVRNIQLQTLTDDKVVKTCVLQDLEVADMNEDTYLSLPEVYTRTSIPVGRDDLPRKREIERWPYLKEIELHEIEAEVGILIGNNVPKAMEPLQVINSQDDGPFACRTVLGWMVFGCWKSDCSTKRISSHRVQVMDDAHQQLVTMFQQDFSERIVEDKPEKSMQDRRFLESVEASIQQTDGHYEIGLPLKGMNVMLPDNRPQAEQRLAHLQRKFTRQPQFHEEYKGFMKKTIDKGYAEKVPEDELERKDGRKWYIPHHGVFHPQKKKIRVVYDCAASYKGHSLNENLLQGPDLTNSLVGVLTRFRQDHVAVMADIEAMFSQVRIPKRDRDLLRFLWWTDGDAQGPMEEYRMTVHVFGATSSPSCANYALRQTGKEHGQDETSHLIQSNFYVDDCLFSTSTVEKAIQLSNDLQDTCAKGGFHITKWISNDRRVLNTIPKEERASEIQELNFEKDSLPNERALGILWCAETDMFGYNIAIKDRPPTKRGVLSIVSSVYDPLGFVSPVILIAKQLLQDLCRQKIGWDDVILPKQMKQWQGWLDDLPKLSSFKMERSLRPEEFGQTESISMHHFSDASEVGYGVVSYLRLVNGEGEVRCSFLMSKSRVAPIKKISIPRMELTAACVAVRVDQMIKRELELPVEETFFWTDSMTVLRYISNETARFQTFVANRLAVIHDGSNLDQWHYVNTHLNPADACSRGLKAKELLLKDEWKTGPAFLQKPEEEWPKVPDVSGDEEEPLEIKKACLVGSVKQEETDHTKDDVLERLVEHYSDWNHLKKGVAWLLRLKRLLKAKSKGQMDNQAEKPIRLLTVDEMQQAEETILSYVQNKAFPTEIASLKKQEHIGNQQRKKGSGVKRSSPIYKLDPKLDENLLRVGGRLNKADLPTETKHPIILPKKGHVSELILRHIHDNSGHCGRNFVLANLQQKYYMLGANSAVRRMIGKCVKCRRQRGQVMQQMMADLPADRLKPDDPPFTRVGVDYFGPIEVKRGRSMVKRYGVVFTCLAIRAVHIEKADSLDTDSCIAAIRRFIARRGAVREMRSDNGTNLVGAEKELRKELESWNQAQLHNAMLQKNIKWTFNPPGGSHHGGVWERQIRTIRQLLFFLTKQQSLSDESLQTFFCEAESIVNGRPITRVSSDANDLEALTPNQLLTLKANPQLPPTISKQTDNYARRRWRQVQYLADVFWRRWLREYLPQLQARQKWVQPDRNVRVGDVVLVVDETVSRNVWPLGVIVTTTPDQQGMVRRVEVKTKSGRYSRPITKLCLILEGDL